MTFWWIGELRDDNLSELHDHLSGGCATQREMETNDEARKTKNTFGKFNVTSVLLRII